MADLANSKGNESDDAWIQGRLIGSMVCVALMPFQKRDRMRQRYRVMLTCTLLLGTALFFPFRSYGEEGPIRNPLNGFPDTIGDWVKQETKVLKAEVLNTLKVKDYLMRQYVNPSRQSLWLYIGYWDAQRKGVKMHSLKCCLTGSGWKLLDTSRVIISLPPPYARFIVNRYLIQKDQVQQLILYWYHLQGVAVADEIDVNLELVWNAITRNRTDGAIIRLTSPIYGSVEETLNSQITFIQAMYPVLDRFVPE